MYETNPSNRDFVHTFSFQTTVTELADRATLCRIICTDTQYPG